MSGKTFADHLSMLTISLKTCKKLVKKSSRVIRFFFFSFADFKRARLIERTGCIIDMDGFEIPVKEGGYKFLCKELGVSFLYKDVATRYTFQVGDFYSLLPKARITAAWVMRHIHGMKFEDRHGDFPQSSIYELLLTIQLECIAESGKSFIAYKGGHYERDLLREVGIPYYNLESIGCPRYDQLLKDYDVITSPTCGLHSYALKSKQPHCPQAETMLFRKWLMNA